MSEAVILVGGKGNRLRSVVSDRPKPMAVVAGRPFVEWLLFALKAQGVRRAVLSTGHLAEVITEYFGDGRQLGMKIVYVRDPAPLGTGGALRHALDQVQSNPFLVLNGDSYCRFDLCRLLKCHRSRRAQATLCLTWVEDCGAFGSVVVDDGGAVRTFCEKTAEKSAGLISAGIYLLERSLIETMPLGRAVSLESEVFPALIGQGLCAVVGEGPFLDIGTPESYRMASVALREEFRMLEQASHREEQVRRAQGHLRSSASLKQTIADQGLDPVLAAVKLLEEAFRTGHKLLLCGNGGSAADCQHMAAEFVSRLTKEFERPGLPAIALTTDTSFLTAFANDRGFDGVFERQVRALGQPGDVLIGISTSGSSVNVVRAVDAARAMGLKTVGLLGEGGALTDGVDCPIVVPSKDTQHVQEALLSIEHILCDLVEQALFAGGKQEE